MLENLAGTVRNAIEPKLTDLGYEIVELGFHGGRKRWLLKILADRINGNISLDDCVEISRTVGDILDREDLIPHSYNLEVSSPGLDRPLKTQRDFQRRLGEQVKIISKEPIGKDNTFIGYISECDEQKVILKLENEDFFSIDYGLIARATLIIEV